MYKALDVARMVIWLTDTERGDFITEKRLYSLMYYLQGFWLAKFERPLFDSKLVAMPTPKNCIRVPNLPCKYAKYCGPIDVYKEGKRLQFKTMNEEGFFNNVFNSFNQYATSMLLRMICADSLWTEVQARYPRSEIGYDEMEKYFKPQLKA